MRSIALLIFIMTTQASAAVHSFGVLADAGAWTASTRQTRASMQAARVTRLVLPGDNVYGFDSYEGVWSHWTNKGFSFDVVALGNHNHSYAEELRFFRMPGEFFSRVLEGNVRFIVLNSDNESTAAEQASWLERELSSATERAIFIVFHHPSYTLSDFHSWTEKRAFHVAVRPVLWRHRSKISALLVGHDHVAELAEFDGIPVVVSGASFETRATSPRDELQDGARVRSLWLYDRKPHWARLDVDARTGQSQVTFIRSADSAETCTAKISQGRSLKLLENCRRAHVESQGK